MRKLLVAPLPRPDLLLVGILLLAIALRAWGLTWGLPSATHYFSYHPDESRVLEASSVTMNVFAGRLLPHFYNYGSLQLYLVCFANTLAALFGGLEIVPKDFAVWYPQWAKMYLIGRWLTVGMGVGTVWAVFAIGKRLWGRRAGLLAALTLAIMPLHAQHSHFLTVDVPATFWAMLSLLWAVRLATGEPKPWKAALWAGVFAGFAAATKYNLALIILPLMAACFLTRHKSGAAISLAAFALAFLVACPGAVLESAAFLRDIRFEAVHMQNTDDPTFRATGNGFVYQIARNLEAGLGLPLLLLTLVSVGYAVYKRERGDGLLAAFALPYYILIGLAAVKYARYDIPLLPILALWNGRLLADISRISRAHIRWPVLSASVAILLLTLIYARLLILPMTQPDPRDAGLQKIRLLAGRDNPGVGFAVQPWFGTVPMNPYFSMPEPGGWRKAISPEDAASIMYAGKDWDPDPLKSQGPAFVVLSEYDYTDALRLKDPAVGRYLSLLQQNYQECDGTEWVTIDAVCILGNLSTSVGGMPSHGLPHDMLYTNPYIIIYQRKHATNP